jgi:hypothetical protein
MYAYCASQSREEFSALDTSRIAMSFLAGASSPAPPDVAASADGHWLAIAAVPNAASKVRRVAFLRKNGTSSPRRARYTAMLKGS